MSGQQVKKVISKEYHNCPRHAIPLPGYGMVYQSSGKVFREFLGSSW
jgi:hypothetical protein